MRAQDRIGRETRDLRIELARVELFGRALEPADQGVTSGSVGLRVEPGPQLRQSLDQLDVLLAVELLELFRYEGQEVEMYGLEGRIRRFRGGFEGLCGADMSGTGGDTENQDAAGSFSPPILDARGGARGGKAATAPKRGGDGGRGA